jgi:4-amino-4-deoxy-L-arabinose transferase-like glycosyltransferase
MKEAALLAAFAALILVDLGAVALIDYDEAAYAQVAHEMLLRGEWWAPSLGGEPFFEKPPLLYWGQILGYRWLGVSALGARAGNALAGLATLAALYAFSRRPLGARVARLGALVLGSSLVFVSLARVALTDLWLLLFIVLALGCLHRALEAAGSERSGGSLWFAAFGACCGFAMLAKGAAGAVLPAAAGLLHLAGLRRLSLLLRPAWWLPSGALLLGIGLAWYLVLGLTRPDGFAFLSELFLEQHIERFLHPMHGHRGSILYYVPVLALAFVPWSAFLPVALARRPGLDGERERWLRLVGLHSAVAFVLFSAAATKLPHYIVPAFPGLALWVADRLEGDAPPGRRSLAASVAATVVLLIALAGVLATAESIAAALPARLGEKANDVPGLAHPLDLGPGLPAAALAALATAAVVIACRRAPRRLALRLGLGSMIVWALLAWTVMPRWDAHFQRPLRDLAVQAAASRDTGEPLLLVGLPRRPSVLFYAGRAAEYTSGRRTKRVARRLKGPPPRLAISSRATFDGLARSLPIEAISQDTGYVLFRAAEPPGGRDALP